jgi:hypothetical protein
MCIGRSRYWTFTGGVCWMKGNIQHRLTNQANHVSGTGTCDLKCCSKLPPPPPPPPPPDLNCTSTGRNCPTVFKAGCVNRLFGVIFVCSLLKLILLPRQAWDKQEETLRKDGGLSFPYVCPEPVLVKWRILSINGVYLFVQDERRGRNVFSLLPPAHLCGRDCKREAAAAGHDALAGDDRGELAARWRELGRRPSLRVVRGNATSFAMPFYTKTDHFTKTGSGQTSGNVETKMSFFVQERLHQPCI